MLTQNILRLITAVCICFMMACSSGAEAVVEPTGTTAETEAVSPTLNVATLEETTADTSETAEPATETQSAVVLGQTLGMNGFSLRLLPDFITFDNSGTFNPDEVTIGSPVLYMTHEGDELGRAWLRILVEEGLPQDIVTAFLDNAPATGQFSEITPITVNEAQGHEVHIQFEAGDETLAGRYIVVSKNGITITIFARAEQSLWENEFSHQFAAVLDTIEVTEVITYGDLLDDE